MTHPWFAPPGPRVLAHRGFVPPDAEGIVENSLAAFAAAHAIGAAYVESDCHLTADGAVVLFHDEDLSRVAADARKISEVRVRELEAIMADRGGLLTLAAALQNFPTLRFNIDVKAAAAAEPAGKIVGPFADRVLLTSFSDSRRRSALAAARAAGGVPATSAGARVFAGVLAAAATRSSIAVRRALRGVDALQIPERHAGIRTLSTRLLDAVHRHGVEVHVWTVNDAGDMDRLLALGVDGLVSDRADLALSAVLRQRSSSSLASD